MTTKPRRRSLRELIADVDAQCRTALADATDAREAGKSGKRHEARAQKLLDRLNDLEERAWLEKRANG